MLPELIYTEEKRQNLGMLFLLGLLSGIGGYAAASIVFPSEVSILAVVFASIPLVYPLTRKFLEDEKRNAPHIDEIFIYSSIFAGEVAAFFLLVFAVSPDQLSVQISQFAPQLQMMGIETLPGGEVSSALTGQATGGASFISIALHNSTLFFLILCVSALISSSGAFILTWNASVLGVFLGSLTSRLSGFQVLSGANGVATPLAYVPHASLEMAGFIVAGISGSLISAALYREHFDTETWKDYGKLVGLGLGLILLAAFLETA